MPLPRRRGILRLMKYRRFEELPAWQAVCELIARVDGFREHVQVARRGDLADQPHRAALSVSNNIAEGFEPGTTPQSLSHLYIARGSAGEVRGMLCRIERIGRFEDLKSEISDLKSLADSCSWQLRAIADSLQNSGIKGPRFLTDLVREEAEKRARREAFEAKRAQVVDDARIRRETGAARAAGGPR